jgi:hypothetical protein
MNIQAKFNEVREATVNLSKMVEGLKSLRESILPNHEIEAIVEARIAPFTSTMDYSMQECLDRCRQEIGEAVQVCQSTEARISARLSEIETEIVDLRESLDAFAEAASKRKRR